MSKPGERLAEWRRKNGVTQSTLGERLGVSQEYVCQIERGVIVRTEVRGEERERRKLPGLKVASAIEKLTDGEIPAGSWAITDESIDEVSP